MFMFFWTNSFNTMAKNVENDVDLDMGPVEQSLRSIHSNQSSKVIFKCHTDGRRANLYWLNYQGKPISYKILTVSDNDYQMNTYVTHPWIARDEDSGDELLLNGQLVYYPQEWSEGQPQTRIHITLPVYTLRTRCLQKIRQMCEPENYTDLELPQVLLQDLHNCNDPLLNIPLGPNKTRVFAKANRKNKNTPNLAQNSNQQKTKTKEKAKSCCLQ